MTFLFLAWRDLAHENAGGSEVVVDRLILELQDRGHEATLVCGGPVGERPYPVIDAGGTFTQYLKGPLLARKVEGVDVVIDVINGMGFNSPLWWRGPRLAVLHHVHADQWKHHFSPTVAKVGWFVERELIPRVYRSTEFLTISESSAVEMEAIGIPHEQIHQVHLGLDDELFAEPLPKSETPLFVVLGRLQPNKGVGRLLDAWEQVQPRVGGRLAIVGDGPLRDELEARNLPGVEWLGRVSDEEKRALLGSAWLLVHGAYQEGLGMVMIEAAAQRTPTLAFDAPGVRDATVDGKTGVLVTDPSQMVEQWVALTEDEALRRSMGEVGRARALGYTWSAATDEFLAAVDAAIHRVRRRSL